MDDLDWLRRASLPRHHPRVRHLVQCIHSTRGFVLYGVCWLIVAAFGAMMLGAALGSALASLLAIDDKSATYDSLLIAMILLVFLVACWLFVRWVRSKRKGAMLLVREGVLVEATVATTTGDRLRLYAARLAALALGQLSFTHSWERLRFVERGRTYEMHCPFEKRAARKSTCVVLFHGKAKYALAFDDSGDAVVARVRRRRSSRL